MPHTLWRKSFEKFESKSNTACQKMMEAELWLWYKIGYQAFSNGMKLYKYFITPSLGRHSGGCCSLEKITKKNQKLGGLAPRS